MGPDGDRSKLRWCGIESDDRAPSLLWSATDTPGQVKLPTISGMRPVLAPQTKARVDAEHSEPVSVLMARAGRAVAQRAVAMGVGYGSHVVVAAGPGNNGGDGYVAARFLRERGANVRLVQIGSPKSAAAREAAAAAVASGARIVPPIAFTRIRHPDLFIDALFGGTYRPRLGFEIEELVPEGVPVLAIDLPTGLDPSDGSVPDLAVKATTTVTFHAMVPGHLLGEGPDMCGDVVVADIGLTGGEAAMFLVEEADLELPLRDRRAHKWSAGSVLVVGGDDGMIGAAVMAGRAALHFGAGAVGVATSRPDLCQQLAPELLAYPMTDLPARFDVVCAGPGLAKPIDSLLEHRGPLVLDAGALHRGLDLRTRRGTTVLTPHAGESAAMEGADERAAQHGWATVLHKGNPTRILHDAPTKIVTTGGPELATIGTGDVLSGMVSALCARGVDGAPAAWTAAWLHGYAASALARRRTVTADLLIDEIGAVAWGLS